MASTSPIARFDNLAAKSAFIFAVVYRGHWCPFCMTYLKTFATLAPSITAAGGTPVIITAESEDFLKDTRAATKYEGEAIVDTENQLVGELRSRDFVDVAISKWKGYEHGLAQPAVLVLKRDGTVLESWAIVPGMMNLGGAKDRPLLEQIWENVQADIKGQDRLHKNYSKFGASRVLSGKLFG